MKNEVKHTAHSSYRCEYHVVFAPKYRRKVIYKTLREDVIEIIKKAVQRDESGNNRRRGLPKPHPSFDRHANLKYKYGSRNFWCRGYFVDTVGKNAKMIQEYIQNQLEEDLASDQITLKEYIDPFTGSKRK